MTGTSELADVVTIVVSIDTRGATTNAEGAADAEEAIRCALANVGLPVVATVTADDESLVLDMSEPDVLVLEADEPLTADEQRYRDRQFGYTP
jgi:hypothetical protein